MVGGKLAMKWCGSEFKQTTTESARNSANLSSAPQASKILSLIPGRKSCRKPPMDSAARRIARWMRSGSNFTSARLRFWTLTIRFCTAMADIIQGEILNPKLQIPRVKTPLDTRHPTPETQKHGHQHCDRSNPASLQEHGHRTDAHSSSGSGFRE